MGEKKATEFFDKMLEKGLWIKHGVTVRGSSCYCPAMICEGTMRDIYVCEVNDGALGYYVKVNREALRIYAASEARWENNTALRDFEIVFLPRGDICAGWVLGGRRWLWGWGEGASENRVDA